MKKLADYFLGDSSEENSCPTEVEDCADPPEPCSNEDNIQFNAMNVKVEQDKTDCTSDNGESPDPCQDQGDTEMQVLTVGVIDETGDEVPTRDEDEEITVAMAYDIRTKNPFSLLANNLLKFKNLWSFGESSENFKQDKKIITTEEIPKTPLPKFRRKQSTRKLRQRHYLTPSLETRIRRILTTYKFQQFGQEIVEDKEEFHSAQVGDFYENIISTEPNIYSVEESNEVFSFNVLRSRSSESVDSSNIEYEIACDNILLDSEHNISERDDCQNLNNDEPSSSVIPSTLSNQSNDFRSDLNNFVFLIKEAINNSNESPLESDSEYVFTEILHSNMEMYPNLRDTLSVICKHGLNAFNRMVTSSNYDELQEILRFIKHIRNKCDDLNISVNP